MIRLFTAALAALVFAGTAFAQGTPPTVFMTAWKCDQSAMGDLADTARERMLPIAQAMKDEGTIQNYAVLGHHWGDEWNFMTVLMADDLASGHEASAELRERYSAENDPAATLLDHCTSHRDAVHAGAWQTQRGRPIEPGMTVAVSHFACPFTTIGAIIEAHERVLLPASQASVDEGHGLFVAATRHEYGDEWTYAIWRAASDLPAFVAFNADANERATALAQELMPDAENPMNACTAHKDNIYGVIAATN